MLKVKFLEMMVKKAIYKQKNYAIVTLKDNSKISGIIDCLINPALFGKNGFWIETFDNGVIDIEFKNILCINF